MGNRISEKKLARNQRNAQIVRDFTEMDGNITARCEELARVYNMAVISIRTILKRNGMIGCDLANAIREGGNA